MRSYLRMALISALILGLSWFLAGLRLAPKPVVAPIIGTLRVGWMEYYPYQFTNRANGSGQRDGLGFILTEACFHRAGYSIDYLDLSWQAQLEAFEKGQLDVIMLAAPSPERMKSAHFSRPYANFKIGTFYAREHCPPPPEEPEKLAAFCRDNRLKLALTRGFVLPAELVPIIEEARRQGRLVELERPDETLQTLLSGKAQVAFIDELVGFSMSHPEIAYQELQCPPDATCLMFNRATVRPETVERFNRAFEELARDGSQSALVRTYLYPRLLGLLTQHKIFHVIILAAAMFAGFTGVLIARREKYDWVGALVLASCPAVGGGIVRDLVLSRNPLGVVADPVIMLGIACLVAGVGLFFRFAPHKWRDGLEAMDPSKDQRLLFFDTLGLAAYTVSNVFLAMTYGCEPLWLWGPLLAVFQNGCGGAIRDILIGRAGNIAILKGVIYGEIAFVGALGLSLFFIHYSQRAVLQEEHMAAATGLTMLFVLVTRTLVIRKGWQAARF